MRVPGVDGYDVSDAGGVRSLDRSIETVRGPRRLRGRVLRPYDDGHGYLAVTLSGRIVRVHALVLTAFVGPRPPGAQTCHDNGVRADNRLRNLAWCTPTENVADQLRHGTHAHARRTVCPRGHTTTDRRNLVAAQARRGRRSCLACDRARSRVRSLRRAGVPYDLAAVASTYLAEILAVPEPERGAAA
ncbi:NUMOD4 motif-containing HNH endonuclease [Pseudonocardia sp. NPDC049635]|uniref:NUMOD4 motif-containing HNH endonuclease n=1 Tax=Pseudonocardia sp. NPDC049635 TaxID=3155506 RepID=UPI0034069106